MAQTVKCAGKPGNFCTTDRTKTFVDELGGIIIPTGCSTCVDIGAKSVVTGEGVCIIADSLESAIIAGATARFGAEVVGVEDLIYVMINGEDAFHTVRIVARAEIHPPLEGPVVIHADFDIAAACRAVCTVGRIGIHDQF